MIFRALDNVCHFKKCEMDRYQPREKRYQENQVDIAIRNIKKSLLENLEIIIELPQMV